jgi:Carboxymuconolactone decarboxylase family
MGRPVAEPRTGRPGSGVGRPNAAPRFPFRSIDASVLGMPLKSKQPRIAPLDPPYGDQEQLALDSLGPPIQLFRVLARRPDLAQGVASWGRYYLSRKSALTLRQRELVIGRTTAICGASYEWGIHVAFFAAKAELDAAQVSSLGRGAPDDACWPDPGDRAVLRAVDELHATCDLTDETWDGLTAAAGLDGALEAILVCGWYHAISFAVRALRLPDEPGTPSLPEATAPGRRR